MPTIHRSPLPDVEIPPVAITSYAMQRAEELRDHVAIRDVAGETSYTFAELNHSIHTLAGGLQARGFGPGSVLALMLPNRPEYPIVFHGAAVAGGATTFINPFFAVPEMQSQLIDSGASILVTEIDSLTSALAAIDRTAVTEVFVVGGGDNLPDGCAPISDLHGAAIEQVPVDLADHTVALTYSSGTTGLPKGVMLTHRNLVANLEQCKHAMFFDDDDISLAVLPFFHIYGLQLLLNGLLANGVTVVTVPRFEMELVLQTIQDLKVTRFFTAPPVILGLAKSPLIDSADLSSLRQVYSGGSPLGADLTNEASARIGCPIVQGYGMSELSPVSHSTIDGQVCPGTCGVAVSNTEIRIVDPDSGRDLGVGKRGELWVRGPQVMKGYLNNPEATADTVDREGWLRTGDIAVLDEHHHMSIVDRLKALIKYKAFQISPAQLEAVIVTHAKVADVAVAGIPDEAAGQLPKAFVVAQPGETVTLSEIQELMAEHLAAYKRVHSIELVDSIPRTAAGKIMRPSLLDR